MTRSFKATLLAEPCRQLAEADALQATVDALNRLQTETAGKLDALLDRTCKGE